MTAASKVVRIPALAGDGLDLVPGYRIDPATGQEDPTWRPAYFAWYGNVRDWRVWAQEKFAVDPDFRAHILHFCQKDSIFFTLLFMSVEEPRSMEYFDPSNTTLDEALAGLRGDLTDIGLDELGYRTIHPFIPFDYQVTAHRLLTYTILGPLRSFYHDLLWDKARGIGMSYAFLAWAYWAWCFIPGIRGTILTEKWDKAERSNDLNSLFGKLDLFLAGTPAVLIPEDFKDKGERMAHRQKGSLTHPRSGAALFTEPTTADSTRGGREAFVGVDEINFHEYLDETWATVGGTTKHRCGWSSANYRYGRQGERLFTRGREHPKAATVVTLDWFENPHQDQIWYHAERERFRAAGQEEQFEVEYLRNAGAGSGTLVYKNQLQRIAWVDQGYDASKPLKMSVDTATSDFTAFVFWQTHFPEGKKRIRFIDACQLDKVPVYFWAHVMTGIPPRGPHLDDDGVEQPADVAWTLAEDGAFERGRIAQVMEWMATVNPHSILLYGDPSMRRRDVTHQSWISVFETETLRLRRRQYGADHPNAIPIYCNLPWEILYKRNNFHDRRSGMREALMMAEFARNDGAGEFVEALENTRMQTASERNTRPPGQIHDIYSHYDQAGSYGMIWETLALTPDDLKAETLPEVGRMKSIHAKRRARTQSPYQRAKRTGDLQSLVGVGS